MASMHAPLVITYGTLRLLQPDKQETPFRLLLDVKDISRPPVLQDNPLFGINGRYAHGGDPTWLTFPSTVHILAASPAGCTTRAPTSLGSAPGIRRG
jgi:hypothetical protein